MGVVYKAIDTVLDQVVALKLIRPALALTPAYVERFKDEVRLARQISHPGICRVHDLGEHHGALYVSMEWVEGETLRRLLHQAGSLGEERALEIAEAVAGALGAAHSRGIIHRDLKPENIMIDPRGSIRVMDFGLAVGTGSAANRSNPRAAGTPLYMSPEQKRGEDLDARSDLYSLGLIFLEMVTGVMPSSTDSGAHRTYPQVPRHLRPALVSLLSEDPGKRCPSAQAAMEVLRKIEQRSFGSHPGSATHRIHGGPRRRWAMWAVPGVIVLAGAVFLTAQHARLITGAPPAQPVQPSPGDAYYQRGMDYLREDRENLRGLDDGIQMFRRALDLDPGSARAWASLAMGFWLRFKVTQDPSSRDEARRALAEAERLHPALPEAQCAQGIGFLVEANYPAAVESLKKAVASRPDLDIAWLSLGTAHRDLGQYAEGLNEIQTAIQLRPYSPIYQIAMGCFYEKFGENDAAGAAYRRAIALKPDSRWAWNNLGASFLRIERPDAAIEAFEHSIAIEETASARSNLGTAYFHQGSYEDAAKNYRRATELQPSRSVHWGNLGDALTLQRRLQEAHQAYARAVEVARTGVASRPLDASTHEELALYCAKAADVSCALAEADRAVRMQPEDGQVAFTNAIVRSLLGRREEALDWLDKAIGLGLTRAEITNEPALAPLRSSPRYRKLVGLTS